MANFKSGGSRGGFRPGGRSDFQGGDRGSRFGGGGDRDMRPRTMHEATCSSCGKSCEVPFRPTGEKPVYCRDCFNKQGGGAELGRQAGARGAMQDRRDFAPRSAPMSPRTQSGDSDAGMSEVKKQLEQVNAKFERLILAVQALVQVEKPVVVKKVTKKIAKLKK